MARFILALAAAACVLVSFASAAGLAQQTADVSAFRGTRSLLQTADAPLGNDEDDIAGTPPDTNDDGADDFPAAAPGDDEDDVAGTPPDTNDDGSDDFEPDDDGADDGGDEVDNAAPLQAEGDPSAEDPVVAVVAPGVVAESGAGKQAPIGSAAAAACVLALLAALA